MLLKSNICKGTEAGSERKQDRTQLPAEGCVGSRVQNSTSPPPQHNPNASNDPNWTGLSLTRVIGESVSHSSPRLLLADRRKAESLVV